MTAASKSARQIAIETEAKRQARKLFTHPAVRAGIGGETAIENGLMEMACFAVGQALNRQSMAAEVIKASEAEDATASALLAKLGGRK